MSLLPVASGSAVMARVAADSSPRWTRAVARHMRAASPAGSGRELGVETAAAASRSRSTHLPARKRSQRRSNSARGTRDSPGDR